MCLEFFHFAILNRVGGTGFCTGWLQAIFHAVITQRAFARRVRARLVTSDHPKGAGDDAVTTAITNILLHIYRVELCTNNRPGRTGLVTGSMSAVFAHVTAHQPALTIEKGQGCAWRSLWNRVFDLFDELHMSPGNSA